MTTVSIQLNGNKFPPVELKANGAREDNRWKTVFNYLNKRRCKWCIIVGILVIPAVLLVWGVSRTRCTYSHSQGDPTGNLSCLISDAKQALECMGCNAPTLMKLSMLQDDLEDFIPDVGYVALLGCLNATSYCHDPELECCPDVENKVSRNISLVGTKNDVHVKRHYEIFEFTKCKCQPQDKCIRREEVIGKFVQEEAV